MQWMKRAMICLVYSALDYPTRKLYLLRLIYDNQQCCDSFYKNKPHWHKVFRLRKSEVQNFPWVNSFKDFCAKVLQKYKPPRSVKLFYKLNFPHFSSFFPHFGQWFIKVLYCCIHLEKSTKMPTTLLEGKWWKIYGASKTQVFRKPMQFL